MTISQQDIKELEKLEESLWLAETRFDKAYLEEVFAPDFFEFGRSGKIYSREECLGVEVKTIEAKLPLENFEIHEVDENNVLITYVSEVMYDSLEKGNRSSLWSRTSKGWQLRFHQGTPVAEEIKNHE